MAKSLRSKWRRKCRAVKRIRYGQKELERLKKTLGITESENHTDTDGASEAVVMDDATPTEQPDEEEQMEIVQVGKRTFNSKTMKDQHGSYPVWMHPRKIRKQKRLQQKKKKSN